MTAARSFAELPQSDMQEGDVSMAVKSEVLEPKTVSKLSGRKWHFDPNLQEEGIAFGVSFLSNEEEREQFEDGSSRYFVYNDWVYLGECSANGRGTRFVLPDSVSPDVRVNVSIRVCGSGVRSLRRSSEPKLFNMCPSSDGKVYVNLRVFPDAEIGGTFEQVLIQLYDVCYALRVRRAGRKIWLRVVKR